MCAKRRPPSEMPPYITSLFWGLTGNFVLMPFGANSGISPCKWYFKADSSSCPAVLPPMTPAQQMVQVAWHRFTGSGLGEQLCQPADSFFEVVHSGNRRELIAQPWPDKKKLNKFKSLYGIQGFMSVTVPTVIFHW